MVLSFVFKLEVSNGFDLSGPSKHAFLGDGVDLICGASFHLYRAGVTWTWTTPEAGRLVVADLAGRVVLAQDAAAGQPLTWNASGTTVVNFVSERGQRQSWKLALR